MRISNRRDWILRFGVSLPCSQGLLTSGQTNSQPVELTSEQDHARTMELLGIKTPLRRGADRRNPQAENAANYDESKANPIATLPDPLTLKNGTKVKTAKDWWTKRRPEIVEDFDREIYGRMPKNTPNVKWEVTSAAKEMNGNVEVVTKHLLGHVDNSSYPPSRLIFR